MECFKLKNKSPAETYKCRQYICQNRNVKMNKFSLKQLGYEKVKSRRKGRNTRWRREQKRQLTEKS